MTSSDDRRAEVLAAFQAAALQMIAATRAVLDMAEELVRDPEPLADVVTTTVQSAGEVLRNLRPDLGGTRDRPPSSPIEHIPVR